MTAPANPYAMPAAPAATPAPTNPYATAPAPANPYAAQPTPAPVTAPAPTPAPAPAAPAGGDPFGDPAPQAPRGPRLQEMAGRLILITPKLTEQVLSSDPKRAGEYVTRMTADVVILDGGPCAYGGKPEGRPPTQHDKVAQIPHRSRDMFISAVGIVSQCREALEKRQRGEPGMVLGRLGYGEQKRADYAAPWLLAAATDADKAIARAYLATVDPFGN
jgi:hypothetical protein